MAKTEAPEATPQFEIGEYVGLEKPNKFDAEVEALIAAQDALPDEKKEAGVRAKITVNFPKYQENKSGVKKEVVAKYRRYFQDSAKAHNRTAREVGFQDNGDDSVNVTFVLTDQIKRPRRPVEAPVEASTSDTAPAEDAA